jgi:transcriptional regulator with XRE-family HTH domain
MTNYTDHALARYRRKHRLSRHALADKLGVDKATVYRWEKGDRDPDRTNLEKIFKVTGIRPTEIFQIGSSVSGRRE